MTRSHALAVALTDATLASDDDQLKVLPAIAAPEAFLAIASSCTCTPSAVTVLIVSGTGVTATVEREESPSGWVESPLHDHVKANTEQKQYERDLKKYNPKAYKREFGERDKREEEIKKRKEKRTKGMDKQKKKREADMKRRKFSRIR